MTILVPRGAEAAAVRRARTGLRIEAIAPGAAAAGTLPELGSTQPVVVLGLCGALRDHRVGDVVVYRSVADPDGAVALDAALATRFAVALAEVGVAPGTVAACTTDHVVTTVAERRALAARYGADVVDMEGTPLAAALAARGLPFAMIRVVSDDAARDLPALEGAIRADGRVDAGRIALAFARSPLAALAFVRDVLTALPNLTAAAHVVAEAVG